MVLRFRHCKDISKALLPVGGVTDPTKEQVEEEYHAIAFLYKSYKQRYGKLL